MFCSDIASNFEKKRECAFLFLRYAGRNGILQKLPGIFINKNKKTRKIQSSFRLKFNILFLKKSRP